MFYSSNNFKIAKLQPKTDEKTTTTKKQKKTKQNKTNKQAKNNNLKYVNDYEHFMQIRIRISLLFLLATININSMKAPNDQRRS